MSGLSHEKLEVFTKGAVKSSPTHGRKQSGRKFVKIGCNSTL